MPSGPADRPVGPGAHRRGQIAGRRRPGSTGPRTYGSPRPRKRRTIWRRVAGIGALAALAVPAFLLGAGLAGPSVGTGSRATEAAPGRVAQDLVGNKVEAPSPASQTRRRSTTLRTDPTDAPDAPTSAVAGLTVEATVLDAAPDAGDLVRVRVRWSDGDGWYAGVAEAWGDGTEASSIDAVGCAGPAGPHRGELSTAHRFTAEGTYPVRLTVATSDCGGRLESRAVIVSIKVGGGSVASDEASASAASDQPTTAADPGRATTPPPSVSSSPAAPSPDPTAPAAQ